MKNPIKTKKKNNESRIIIEYFLNAAITNNRKKMLNYCSETWKNDNVDNEELNKICELNITDFKLTARYFVSNNVVDYFVAATINNVNKVFQIRLIKDTEPYLINDNGSWGIMPGWIIETLKNGYTGYEILN